MSENNDTPADGEATATPSVEGAPEPTNTDSTGETGTTGDSTPAETNPFDGFPENWREAFSGGDEKRAKQLERVNTIQDFGDIYWNAQDRLSKRDENRPPMEDAGDEAWAEWRKANNIPVDGVYEFSADVLGEDGQFNEFEKPYIEKITGALFEHNVNTDVANAVAKGMKEAQAAQVAALQELDSAHQAALSEAQKQGWGPDAQANKNLVDMLIDKQPEAVRDVLKQARGIDGKLLTNDFGFMNMMANAARVMMPGGHVAVSAEISGKSMEQELKELQQMRKDNYEDWHKPQFAEYRARERVLFDAIDETKKAS